MVPLEIVVVQLMLLLLYFGFSLHDREKSESSAFGENALNLAMIS